MEGHPVNCAQCGYDLTGIGVGQSLAQCPECGATFDPERPLPTRAWPPAWRMGLVLCGGLLFIIACDALGWLATSAGWKEFASVLSEFLSFAWAPAWLGTPILGAHFLSARHAHPSERWMTLLGLSVAGIVVNTVIGFAWLLLRKLLA